MASTNPGGLFGFLLETWRYLIGSEHSRIRQRRALSELDDRLLRDIGITRREALLGRLADPGRARPVVAAAAGKRPPASASCPQASGTVPANS